MRITYKLTDRYDDNNSPFRNFSQKTKREQYHTLIKNVNSFILFVLVCYYDDVLAFLERNTDQ